MNKRRAVPSACWSYGGPIAICLLFAAATACAMPEELFTVVTRSLKGASAGSQGERALQLLRAGKTEEAVEELIKAKRIENTPEAIALAAELELELIRLESDLKTVEQVEQLEQREAVLQLVPEVPKTTLPTSERAAAEESKLREAMTAFRSKNVTLERTTKVTLQDARADFTVQGQRVSIRCHSAVQAAVDAFVDFIDRIFRNGATRTDWTLEQIVSNARQDIMNRFNLSPDQMTVTYIDQFNNTHVVEISLRQSGVVVASR